MTLQGGIDTLTHRRIVGWAWESGAPDVPVALSVAIGSSVTLALATQAGSGAL